MHPSYFFSLTFVASLAAPILSLAQDSPPSSGKQKNVLLICVDDLKPVLGCYGDKIAKTPNIDKLAARGLVLDAAYCNQAVCAPSRHALMVGVRPQRLGIYNLSVPFRTSMPEARTLGQVLQDNGWQTEAMGKIFHHGHGNAEDTATWSLGHYGPKVGVYATTAARKGTAADGKKGPDGKGDAYEISDVADDAYPDGDVANHAVQRLAAAAKTPDKPFFMACGFVKPHLPFNAPRKYWDLYKRDAMPLAEYTNDPVGAPSYATQHGGELRNYLGIPSNGKLPEDLQRTLIHGYYAATSYMDAQLGRVMTALEETGLAASTLVILWGDHGWHLGDHGQWCKHTNYEQATRIPLIFAGPGVTQGRSSALIETVDIFPTVLAWAAAAKSAPSGQLDGLSFAGVLADPAKAHREAVTHVYPRGSRIGRALRTKTHRLVEWKVPGQPAESAELELYDYQADPLEKQNIAATQPVIVKQLLQILAQQGEAKPQVPDPVSSQGKSPRNAPGSKDRKSMFLQRDTDKDGKLSREEFLKGQPDPDEAPKRFPLFDLNKDGSLSEKEFVTSGKES